MNKKVVELLANDSHEAIELKELISQNDVIVNHIYSGSSVPVLKDEHSFMVGSGHIRSMVASKTFVGEKEENEH